MQQREISILAIALVFSIVNSSSSMGYQPQVQDLGGLRQSAELHTQVGNDVVIPSCAVTLIKEIEIPAQEAGKLTEILVKENEAVESNQLIAKMDDQQSKRMFDLTTLKHNMAKQKASDPNEVNAAQARQELTKSEFETISRLYGKRSTTRKEFDRAKLSKEIAQFEYLAAKNSVLINEMNADSELVNVKAAEDSINRHQLKSPISGHVLNIDKQAGEWVNAGETVMTIAPMNRLLIKTNIDARVYNPSDLAGRKVSVTLEMAKGRKVQFQGEVKRTALEISGIGFPVFLVYAEIENQFENGQWLLLPGSQVSMNIHLLGN